jgi:hypothetical protein
VGGRSPRGGPLTVIGRIPNWEHAAVAVAGLVISLAGIGWAIWQTIEALMPTVTTIAELDTAEFAFLGEQIRVDPAAFLGPFGSSVGELSAAANMWETAAANIAIEVARRDKSVPPAVLAQGLADAQANAAQARARLRWLLEYAHARRVRNQLRRVLLRMFVGAAVAAIGALVFVFAASQAAAAPTAHSAGVSSSVSGGKP